MATRYISPTGNDTTGNGSYANPYLTLTKCISVSASGDTCTFKTGTYTIAASVSHNIDISGAASMTLTINSETLNPEDVIIKGATGAEIYQIAAANPYGAATNTYTIQGITFKDFKLQAIAIAGTMSTAPSLIGAAGAGISNETQYVLNCRFIDIDLNGTTMIGIADNHSPSGCTAYHRNNVFSVFGAGLISNSQRSGNPKYVFNNVIYVASGKTPPTAMCVGAYTNEWKNNIIMNDSGTSTPLFSGSPTAWDSNTYYGSFSNIPSTGTGNQNRDPLFVSAATNDFHLRPTSSEIASGVVL